MIIVGGRLQGARYQDKSPWVTSGLVLFLDAADPASYPGSGSLTWYDISGNGNDVELSGGLSYISDHGGYIELASNSYFYRASGNNIPTGNSPYTLSAWVQIPTPWSGNGIMSISNTFGTGNSVNAFRTGSTGQLINYWWGDDLSVFFSNPDYASWFNLVAKYDGTTRSIWVNGVQVNYDTVGPNFVANSYLQIGLTWPAGNEYLNGNYGQAMIYNRALTSDEINQNFNYFKTRYGV